MPYTMIGLPFAEVRRQLRREGYGRGKIKVFGKRGNFRANQPEMWGANTLTIGHPLTEITMIKETGNLLNLLSEKFFSHGQMDVGLR